jgi:hypothetical protein
MALKRLNTEEMVQISGAWLAKGSEVRKALGGVPELAGLVPRIEAAHKALHDTQSQADDPRLAALQAEAAALDATHDTNMRGIHGLLSALALLADADGATELEQLRDLLLPEGLQATQRTYRAEAGAAELLKTRLAGEPAAKKQLRAIPVGKQTALHHVERWMTSAARLGALEDERAQLLAAAGVGDPAKQLAARNQWIRAANALVANAALADLDAETDKLLFGALRAAETIANRRGRAPATEEEPAPAPAPAK